MLVVHSDRHRTHAPRLDVQAGVAVPHVEVPSRAERILEALASDAVFEPRAPTRYGLAPIQAVHANGMIRFLQSAWQSDWYHPPGMPDTVLHAALRDGLDPVGPEPVDTNGRLGYWCFDTGTPVLQGTFDAALGAVDVALSATDLVLDGAPIAYGLCRPPGHHAARALFGGFCYFNNAAIAAEHAARRAEVKVAVLDLDYHHGNGTQQIFYRRPDVLYVSLHADPARAYPYFTGYADETGAGPGLGANLNIPLTAATTDAQYLGALDAALERLASFDAELTIVSLGIDTYALDPLGDFRLSADVYAECGRRVAGAAKRVVVLQEGGYYLPQLGDNVRRFLRGAQGID
jgi:acetoin utilization deacetylase AcuC-like enzyme